jgi:hypothetical protein
MRSLTAVHASAALASPLLVPLLELLLLQQCLDTALAIVCVWCELCMRVSM